MFIHNDLYVSKINITYTDFPKSNIEIISISLRIECLSKIDSMYSVDHRGCVIIPPTSPVLVVAMYQSSCLENCRCRFSNNKPTLFSIYSCQYFVLKSIWASGSEAILAKSSPKRQSRIGCSC